MVRAHICDSHVVVPHVGPPERPSLLWLHLFDSITAQQESEGPIKWWPCDHLQLAYAHMLTVMPSFGKRVSPPLTGSCK